MSRNSQIYTIAGILAVLTVCVVIITVMVASCSREPSEPVSVSPESESSSSEEEPEEAIVDEEDDEEDSSEESSQASSSSTIIYYPSSTPTTTTGTASGSSGTGSSSSSSSSSSVKAAVLSKAGTVRNQTYSTLTIKSSVGDGNVRLENVKLTKQLVINGSDRVELVNCTIPEIVVDNEDETVSLIAKGKTKVNSVVIYTHANLWEEDLSSGYEGFQKVSTKTGRGYTRLKVGLYDTDLDSFRAGELTALSRHNSTVESYLLSSNLVSNSSGSSSSGSSSSSSKSRYMNLDVDDISLDEGEEYEIDVYVEKESNGDDLSGVRVTASVRSGGSYVRLTDSRDTTDKDGYAVIKVRARENGAGDARIRITAKKSGYTTEYKTIDVSVGELDLQSLLNQAANSTSKTVTLTRSYTVSSLTVPSGVTLKIPNHYTLTVSNGTMTNNGTVTVNSGGTLTVGSGASLVNNGTISNSGTFQVGGALANNGSITGNGVTGMNTSATLAMGSNGTLSGTIVYLNGTQETDCQGKTYTWNGTAWNRTDSVTPPVTSAVPKTLEEFKTALANSTIQTITLGADITLDDGTLTLGKTIDCGGFTIIVPSNKTLTISGTVKGAVKGSDSSSKLMVTGALSGANVEGVGPNYYWNIDKWSPVVNAGAVTTAQELRTALDQSAAVTAANNIVLDGSLTVPDGKTLNMGSHILTVPAGSTLTVNGKVEGSIAGSTASLTRSAGTATLTIGSSGSLSGTTVCKNGEPEAAYQGQTYTWDGSRWNRKVEEPSQPQPTEATVITQDQLDNALATGSIQTITIQGSMTLGSTNKAIHLASGTLTVNGALTGSFTAAEDTQLIPQSGAAVPGTFIARAIGEESTFQAGATYVMEDGRWVRATTSLERLQSRLNGSEQGITTTETVSGNVQVPAGKMLTISTTVDGLVTGGNGSRLLVETGGVLKNTNVYNEYGLVALEKNITYEWNLANSRWQRAATAQETLEHDLSDGGTATTSGITLSSPLTIPAGGTLTVTGAVSGSISGGSGSKLVIQSGGSVTGTTLYYSDGTTAVAGPQADTYTWTGDKWVGTLPAPAPEQTPEEDTTQSDGDLPAGGAGEEGSSLPDGEKQVLPTDPADQPGLA